MKYRTQEVMVEAGPVALAGDLGLPARPRGLVVFAHGSGSSRFSARNRFVAAILNEARLATLLFDLLTLDEHLIDEETRHLRFDIPLLSERLTAAVDWTAQRDDLVGLSVGLFGASTGAAAALVAAADRADRVRAVVSRGGRPDLARTALSRVRAPTLLIVGGYDIPVIDLNRDAAQQMSAEHRIEIVPAATHLFEEPGKLEIVARLAVDWFVYHLSGLGGNA